MLSGFPSFGLTVPDFGFPSFGSTVSSSFNQPKVSRVVQALSGVEPPATQVTVPQIPYQPPMVNIPPSPRGHGYRLLGTAPTNPYLDM